MKKLLVPLGALALIGLIAPVYAALQGKNDCNLARVENAQYCTACSAVVEKDGIKDGKCKKDETKLVQVQQCVKSSYHCGCGGGCCKVDSDKPGNCKCNKPLKEDASKCLVVYTCKNCGASSPIQNQVKHDDEKHKEKKDKATARTCEKSGTAPHTATGK
jgi:hypothetical protein